MSATADRLTKERPMAFRHEMTVDELKHRITKVDAEVILWNRGTPKRRALVNEKMELQAELIRRRQTKDTTPALAIVRPSQPENVPEAVVYPCGFCGAETSGGSCPQDGPDYPHPRGATDADE